MPARSANDEAAHRRVLIQPSEIPGRLEPPDRARDEVGDDRRLRRARTTGASAAPPLRRWPSVRLLGIDVHQITAAEAVRTIILEISRGRGGWVLTPNLDILRRLSRDRDFARLCDQTTLRLADGMPLIWASRLQRTPLPERVPGSDLIWSLTAAAAESGRSVYFIGGNPGAADGAAACLRAAHPSLRVAGVECPPIGFENDPAYMQSLLDRLAARSPDIVFVGLGSPKQERLIAQLRRVLPRAWFLGIGISFSFVTGEVRRAPRLLQRLGLEWLHRLIQEPRRLARRYLVHGLPFAAAMFVSAAFHGACARRGD